MGAFHLEDRAIFGKFLHGISPLGAFDHNSQNQIVLGCSTVRTLESFLHLLREERSSGTMLAAMS
jgi:hypothetical protein